jgi:cytochrome c551/c552
MRAACLFLLAITLSAQPPQTQPSALKLIRENCLKCHSGENPPNGLRLDSVDNMVRGGKRGPAVVPFQPDDSLIYQAITGAKKAVRMPPGRVFSKDEVATIRRWISQGAMQMSMSGQEP